MCSPPNRNQLPDVEAFVDGDGATGVSDGRQLLSATATNAVGVRVIAGAVSVAVAVGGDAGVGVSLGLSIALNDVGGPDARLRRRAPPTGSPTKHRRDLDLRQRRRGLLAHRA